MEEDPNQPTPEEPDPFAMNWCLYIAIMATVSGLTLLGFKLFYRP